MSNVRARGFTLIEILIYAAIVTVILSFALFTVYQLIDSDERVIARRELTENQKFVLQKIFWVLKNVDAINSPAVGAGGPSLSVNKLNYLYNPLVVSLNGGTVELTSGATTTPLTNDYATISSLNFEHLDLSGNSVIRITATLENEIGSTAIDTTVIVE